MRLQIAGVAVVAALAAGCTSGSADQRTTIPVTSPATSSALVATSATPSRHSTSASTRRPAAKPKATPTTPAAPAPATARAASLPLYFGTAGATEVITVVAASTSSTQGTVQAWRKVSGGWRRVGPAVHAWLGSDGLTRHPSETRSATPIGTFTLTHAFGRYADPGTAVPYTRTTPADWWISESGSLYNTMQRCASNCPFTLGDPNEHLYYTVPYYRYAVVIDYNTRNSPTGVVQGAGSAFFLHVTVGAPTQGCVSIDQSQLVRIMRWLRPGDHPRILIGIG